MGVITLTLIAAGLPGRRAPVRRLWVIVACALAIALGTYSGGWRIIKTLGRDITDIEPAQGFAAEAATTATILASTHLGFALSTTQVASGSVIGTGHRPQGRVGALAHRRPHRARLAHHDPGVGRRRRARRHARAASACGASSSTSCSRSARSSTIFLWSRRTPGRPPHTSTSPSPASSCGPKRARRRCRR